MDKNKNRTDLLAAGRKKLQQFRQKKDNKGSKSTTKSGKSDRSDNASSIKKAASTSQPFQEGERSNHDADDAVASSESHSREEDSTVENIDIATIVDHPPTSGIAETTAETTVELSLEDSRMGQANLNANVGHEFPSHSSSPNQEGDNYVVVEDEKSTYLNIQQMADPKEQSTDSGTSLPVDFSSQVDRQYEERQNAEGPSLMQVDETAASGIEEDKKLSLPESDGHLAISSEIMGQLREEVMSESSKDKYSEDNSLSADYGCENSEESRVGIVGKETVMEGSSGLNSDVSELDLGSKMVTLSSGSEMGLITLSQLAEVVRKLGGEELSFLLTSRESPAEHLMNADGLHAPVLERLKEQLYLTTFAKDAVHLQLAEQLEIQSELTREHHQFVDKMSTATASLNEVQGKNEKLAEELAQCRSQLEEVVSLREELQEQLNASRAEVEISSASLNALQKELEISQDDLSRISSELIVCRNSLTDLQTENENLLRSLHLVTEEKEQVAAEKKSLVLENERLVTELAQCKILLDSLQSENVDISKNVALLGEENSKISQEKQYLVSQNDKLLAELGDCKSMMEILQLDNAKLNASISEERKKIEDEKEYLVNESEKVAMESINCMVLVEALQMEISSTSRILVPVTDVRNRLEEEKMYLSSENEKLSHELTDCKALVLGLHTECAEAVDDLNEATLRIEQLVEENVYLKSNLEIHKAKITEHDNWQSKTLSRSDGAGNPVEDLSEPSGVHDASDALEGLKRDIKEAENVMQKLEKAVEGMHSCSASSDKSSGKVVTAGVSKLIQAFESKGHVDDNDSEEQLSSGSQSTEDPYELSKEQTANLKVVLQKLLLDAENATKVVADERKNTILANTAVSELNACNGSLIEHNDHLEEANIELMVFSEALRQHIRDVEAREGELVALYEASLKQGVILKAENGELAVKLCDFEAKISELQSQLDEAYQRSDEMLSSLSNQVEALHYGLASREAALEEDWNSIVTEIVMTVGKLDISVASFCTVTDNSLDIRSRVAASVDAATKVIENLKGQVEAACKDHEAVLSTSNELNKELNGLQGQNERAISMLHKICSDLVRLVKESRGFVEETETDIIKGKLLDPQAPGIFDTLIEQVEAFLRERSILESENSKLSSELIDRARDVDELNKKCLGSDAVLKLLEDVEQEFKLEEINSKKNEPVSRLESLIYYLLQKYKEADEQVNLFREMYTSKKVELTEFLGQIDHLSFSLIQHENEIFVLKECLKSAKDAIVVVQSELQEKVAELDQSEQRVSSLREKLSIAVSKGKGLIVQRDSLKKSLAETSGDLEKFKQELQTKDARINELEIKLKAYMEAGERMEALESELSYIRNSATALRESFLLKDSVLQRIEEILEDLELPDHFHSGDIIEKVDWLAKSVSGNSLPLADWDQKSSMGGGSYSDAGLVGVDGWKEETQPNPNTSDDYKRRYEELQGKFYGLAEQNEMLEQSLMERNNLVQRWEEILDRIDVSLQSRSMEPEDKIEWLISALSETQNHCTFLQERIDNLETSSTSLTAVVEESQRRISEVNTAMQSLITEKETLSKNLEILTHDYDEMSKKASQFEIENGNLQKEVSSLQERLDQKHCSEETLSKNLEILTHDYDEMSKKASQFEIENGNLQKEVSSLQERLDQKHCSEETLSKNLDILTHDYDEMSKKASQFEMENGNLQKEVSSLLERLDQKHCSEERIQYLEGEIRRFQDLVRGVLQDSGTDDQVYGSDSIEYFEGLLRKLLEKHALLSLVQPVKMDAAGEQVAEKEYPSLSADRIKDLEDAEREVAVVNQKLSDALGELMYLKEERDRCMETNHSLVREVEALETRMKELQVQLIQEEQKSASIREKLNIAVRKGKSVVQQRDSMKQLIEETNAEMERLKSVIKHHEDTALEYENKIKDLAAFQERIEGLESENMFLRDRMAQNERSLQEKEHTLSMIMNTLGHIDVGLKVDISDPVEKLKEIGKLCSDLRASLVTSQQESSKSKRAAELLLAELNEVQERNDTLQEELAKTANELSELSRERDNYFAEVMHVRSSADQLRTDLSALDKLLGDVLSKDLETLRNLESCIESCVESSDAPNLNALFARGVPGGIISAEPGNKIFMTEIGSLKGQLYRHLDLLHEESSHLADVIRIIHSEMTSKTESCESMKRDIKRLESVENEKDSKLLIMQRSFSSLFEACTSSITEIENWKAELVGHGFATGALGVNIDSQTTSFTEESYSSEEGVRALREKLSSVVKDLISTQAEVFDVNQKDMRSTILNLQKELQEKDIQSERNCMELVGQIKEAEAVAKNYLQQLHLAQTHVEDLQREVSVMHEERILLEKRTKDLQDREAALKELEQRIKSLTDTLAAKEQENEALLQALDEEEAQMEDLTNKIGELERVLQQKNQELESLDVSRGKALKKLSVTVSKFDELHNLSEGLLSEVEKLQSQLQDREREISFLRQEVTRCTNDALIASQISNKRNSDEVSEFLTWLDTIISGVQARDSHIDGQKTNQIDEYKEILKEQIVSAMSELEDLRVAARNGDMLLQLERVKVEELARKEQSLESALREKESHLAMLRGDSGQASTSSSEIMELEPMINKRAAPGAVAPQVRSLRKIDNDHVAVAIDVDPDSERLEDEDDDKAHGFKSLTTSRIVPRFTRPVTDVIDGLWVSCDRTLMRQPVLRLGVIMYWALMHALLATFVKFGK